MLLRSETTHLMKADRGIKTELEICPLILPYHYLHGTAKRNNALSPRAACLCDDNRWFVEWDVESEVRGGAAERWMQGR